MKKSLFPASLLLLIGGYFLVTDNLSNELKPLEPIYIEPAIVPKKVIDEDSDSEILNKLKVVTEEVFKESGLSEEEEADEVLATLKKLDLRRALDSKEKSRVVSVKKRVKFKKKVQLSKKKEIKKVAKVVKKEKKKREFIEKDNFHIVDPIHRVVLGEQNDLHTLSKEEQREFQNLEIISESKPFVLERDIEVKSPKLYSGMVEDDIRLEELPLVETLGVVAVSKPFIDR